jgi:hypothetical protein
MMQKVGSFSAFFSFAYSLAIHLKFTYKGLRIRIVCRSWIRIGIRVKSRIRIRIKVKIQELSRLKKEPGWPWTLNMETWRLKKNGGQESL